MPAPIVVPPPKDESDEELEDDSGKTMATSKFIKTFAKHFRIDIEGQQRKFLCKTYGPPNEAALWACQAFEYQSLALLSEFDSCKKKPIERKALLTSSGVDSKFQTARIVDQRSALLRRLFSGKVDRVEQGIVDTLFKKVVGDMAATNMSLVPKQDKFHATFQKGEKSIGEEFRTFGEAVYWLQTVTTADKAGFFS